MQDAGTCLTDGTDHYHSNTHECLAVCSGNANVILGGPGGHRLILQQGDVIILPAGVGHKCTKHTGNVPVPQSDPLFGDEGWLKEHWGL
jgi:uncharacterized protein YjlB